MLVKKSDITISESSPFANDILNRSESARVLTQFIHTLREPFVLAVDSGWGSGKTTFLKMWNYALTAKGFHCMYFNAWENDYRDDPLLAFLGEIKAELDRCAVFGVETGRAAEHFQRAKNLSVKLIKRSILTIERLEALTPFGQDVQRRRELESHIEELVMERIDNYETDKRTIEEFRAAMSELARDISGPADETEGEMRPVVFFIDELDRCRPEYTVAVLERLKHLFNVPGFVYILAVDKSQLEQSIKSLYGPGMNVEGYLRRFIDMDYVLPSPPLELYCNYLYNAFGFEKFFTEREYQFINEKEELVGTFAGLAEAFGFSLRVLEQCFMQFSMVLRSTEQDEWLFPAFLATIISLKVDNPALYRAYINQTVPPSEVVDYLKTKTKGLTFLEEQKSIDLEMYLVCSFLKSDEDLLHIIEAYKERAAQNDLPERTRERMMKVTEKLKNFSAALWARELFDRLVKKIEVAQRFIA